MDEQARARAKRGLEASCSASKQLELRDRELLAREVLKLGAPSEPPPPGRGPALVCAPSEDKGLAAPCAVTPAAHRSTLGTPAPERQPPAGSMLELVERIQAFVRSDRPGLALTLGGPHVGRVEIERAGPGRISLRFEGEGAARLEETHAAALRAALQSRGLALVGLPGAAAPAGEAAYLPRSRNLSLS